ncbi:MULTISPECIES: hypothetical protein [Nocardioides]|uniref:hypothetical protein n=1 Tax=Nocardioides TaxID=1839 RepID=UPI0018E3F014|nr:MULTISPECIES: hypothetical protein [Nocardioides]
MIRDESTYHLFFLKASRALHDPDRRHLRATIGHAISEDLRSWTEVADALVPSDAPAADDLAVWTGSVIRDDQGGWWMFYTGVARREHGLVQKILAATSTDLMTWHKRPGLVLEADARWYEKLDDDGWHEEAFRDPWVARTSTDGPWQMLITARDKDGAPDNRGVVGVATSSDLRSWQQQAPLTLPGAGFGHLEVLQAEVVNGRAVLIFSCPTAALSGERRARGQRGGIWYALTDGKQAFNIDEARRLTNETVYSGRLIQDPTTAWSLLAFRNLDESGAFVGELADPVRVAWSNDGARLELIDAPDDWLPQRQQR